jgi:hypothetical protein
MNQRYFEICSNYRNRTLYPEPARFEVLISQSGTKDKFTALDPVSDAAPEIAWSPSTINSSIIYVGGNPANTTSKFLVSFNPSSTNNHTEDYYNGLGVVIDGAQTVISHSYFEAIASSAIDSYWITVNPALPTIPAAITAVTPHATLDTVYGVVWLPDSNYADNYYADGYILWNDTQYQYAPILAYDGTTHTAGVQASLISTWLPTDNLAVRMALPSVYNEVTTVQPTLPTPPAGVTYTPYGPTPINGIYLAENSSTIYNYYKGDFIRIPPPATPTTILSANYRILTYSGKGVLSTNPNIPSIPPYLAILTVTPSPAIASGTVYEILPFTRDNAVPFVYTGSTVSQQEMTCYEIQLTNLILPNVTLVNGGRSAFYPYLYVELQNISSSGGGLTNIIYSNNPNATKMLFRATVDDVRDPIITPFIKIDGDGMRQTIKFNPNDSFRFAVYLSNGELFRTLTPDTISPLAPDPLIQLSALFSIKKL